eukprot:Clim_evm41s251 gene=Clim_evmTU41s251
MPAALKTKPLDTRSGDGTELLSKLDSRRQELLLMRMTARPGEDTSPESQKSSKDIDQYGMHSQGPMEPLGPASEPPQPRDRTPESVIELSASNESAHNTISRDSVGGMVTSQPQKRPFKDIEDRTAKSMKRNASLIEERSRSPGTRKQPPKVTKPSPGKTINDYFGIKDTNGSGSSLHPRQSSALKTSSKRPRIRKPSVNRALHQGDTAGEEATGATTSGVQIESSYTNTSAVVQTDCTMLSMDEMDETMRTLREDLSAKKEAEHMYVARIKAEKTHSQIVKKQLCEALRSQCQTDRKLSREEAARIGPRLVNVTVRRQGAELVEVYEEGLAFTDNHDRRRKLKTQRVDIEKELVLLKARYVHKDEQGFAVPAPVAVSRSYPGSLNRMSSAYGGNASETVTDQVTGGENGPLSRIEYFEQLEILNQRIRRLNAEEQKVTEELEDLERQRNLHIREIKRIKDEDSSRFSHCPLLQNRFLLMNLLGKGGFSEVYKAFDVEKNQFVACKIHQLNSTWNERKKNNYIKHACRELQIHENLRHPRIVRHFDVFEIDQDSFATVLDYIPGNDLDFYLKQNKFLDESEARLIITQVMNGLAYLNNLPQPVIHYDLKPGNILLNDGEVKITDFGLSKIMDVDVGASEMELTSQGAGTYWYLPPECFMLSETPRINSKVDVWSVGVIFYQCLFGRKPFGHNMSQQAILNQNTIINAKQVTFPETPVVSDGAKNFLRRCLRYSKEDRPDVRTLVKDPYLDLSQPLRFSSSSPSSGESTPSQSSAGPA